MVSLLLVVAFLLCGGATVRGSDVNWGKKVNCFVVDGTTVCPGCNYRAGLTCPKTMKNSQNCLTTSTPSSTTGMTYDEDSGSTTEEPRLNFNLTTPENDKITPDTDEMTPDKDEITPDTDEIQKEPPRPPIDMSLYLYRILGPHIPSHYRYKREAKKYDDLEICNWNGDCPCPLICCRTGPGCPNRCVMGIRLPPPWG